MPLVGGENFFDGFGFQLPAYRKRYGWNGTAIDETGAETSPYSTVASVSRSAEQGTAEEVGQ